MDYARRNHASAPVPGNPSCSWSKRGRRRHCSTTLAPGKTLRSIEVTRAICKAAAAQKLPAPSCGGAVVSIGVFDCLRFVEWISCFATGDLQRSSRSSQYPFSCFTMAPCHVRTLIMPRPTTLLPFALYLLFLALSPSTLCCLKAARPLFYSCSPLSDSPTLLL